MSGPALTISVLLAGLLLLTCTGRRFVWNLNHRLALITNVGAIRDVDDILAHEVGLMRFYAVDLPDEEDRNLAVALLRAHEAGHSLPHTAAPYMDDSFDMCEPHLEFVDTVDEDEDGVYFIYQGHCDVCGKVYDMSQVGDGPEPEWSREDEMEFLEAQRQAYFEGATEGSNDDAMADGGA